MAEESSRISTLFDRISGHPLVRAIAGLVLFGSVVGLIVSVTEALREDEQAIEEFCGVVDRAMIQESQYIDDVLDGRGAASWTVYQQDLPTVIPTLPEGHWRDLAIELMRKSVDYAEEYNPNAPIQGVDRAISLWNTRNRCADQGFKLTDTSLSTLAETPRAVCRGVFQYVYWLPLWSSATAFGMTDSRYTHETFAAAVRADPTMPGQSLVDSDFSGHAALKMYLQSVAALRLASRAMEMPALEGLVLSIETDAPRLAEANGDVVVDWCKGKGFNDLSLGMIRARASGHRIFLAVQGQEALAGQAVYDGEVLLEWVQRLEEAAGADGTSELVARSMTVGTELDTVDLGDGAVKVIFQSVDPVDECIVKAIESGVVAGFAHTDNFGGGSLPQEPGVYVNEKLGPQGDDGSVVGDLVERLTGVAGVPAKGPFTIDGLTEDSPILVALYVVTTEQSCAT